MPTINSNSSIMMRCLLERIIASTAILVYDGKLNKEPVQVDKPTFYTRVYHLTLDGVPINTWIRFVYNRRDGWADMMISRRDLKEWDRLTHKEEKKCSGTDLASTLDSDSALSGGQSEIPAKEHT